MSTSRNLFAAAAACIVAAAPAFAQQQQPPTPPPLAGPRTLVGLVTDSAGVPLDSVEISVAKLRLRVTSSDSGTFRIDKVKPGTYNVSARRLGYHPQTQEVLVADSGGRAVFSLVPRVATLAPVVSTAKASGIGGIVGDTAYHAIMGAKIDVLASDHHVVSDSLGAFYLNVRPGKYALRVSQPGYASQMVSVTVPDNDGRNIVVWLTPSSRGASAREGSNYYALESRLMRRSAAYSTIMTHEDIAKLGKPELSQLASFAASKNIDPDCEAIVDGGPYSVPVWSLNTNDIEFFEVYVDKPARGGVTSLGSTTPSSIGGGGTSGRKITTAPSAPNRAPRTSPSSGGCGAAVYVWLRK